MLFYKPTQFLNELEVQSTSETSLLDSEMDNKWRRNQRGPTLILQYTRSACPYQPLIMTTTLINTHDRQIYLSTKVKMSYCQGTMINFHHFEMHLCVYNSILIE